jgi:hypothetical protein
LHGQKLLPEETPQRVLLARTLTLAAAEGAAEEVAEEALEVLLGEAAQRAAAALLVVSKGRQTNANLAQAVANGLRYWAG